MTYHFLLFYFLHCYSYLLPIWIELRDSWVDSWMCGRSSPFYLSYFAICLVFSLLIFIGFGLINSPELCDIEFISFSDSPFVYIRHSETNTPRHSEFNVRVIARWIQSFAFFPCLIFFFCFISSWMYWYGHAINCHCQRYINQTSSSRIICALIYIQRSVNVIVNFIHINKWSFNNTNEKMHVANVQNMWPLTKWNTFRFCSKQLSQI